MIGARFFVGEVARCWFCAHVPAILRFRDAKRARRARSQLHCFSIDGATGFPLRDEREVEALPRRTFNKRHVAGVLIVAALVAATVVFFLTAGADLLAFFADGEQLQAWVESKGMFAPLAMVLLVAAQVTIAVLPGEPVELGAGYAFGFWEGTALCVIGGLVGTIAIVALVRTLGMRIVYLFFTPEKVASMKWLQDSARFEALMFVCFLIPASPKDIMTYLAGLTQCPAWRICLIATVGRVPSIVSSTLAAGFAASGNWGATFVVGALTAALAVAGGAAYAVVVRREKKRAARKRAARKNAAEEGAARKNAAEERAEEKGAHVEGGRCEAAGERALGRSSRRHALRRRPDKARTTL